MMYSRKSICYLTLCLAFILSACKPQEGGGHAGTTTPTEDTGTGIEDSTNEDTTNTGTYTLNRITEREIADNSNDQIYSPRGIGGGGAMSGFSISPYSSLWFVGTDMGTLFRSVNRGRTWTGINHGQTVYSSDLDSAAGVGFSANPEVVFHAPAGRNPMRSSNAGINWSRISAFALANTEKIKYWRGHSFDSNYMYAGTTTGLWQSRDAGVTWARLSGIS